MLNTMISEKFIKIKIPKSWNLGMLDQHCWKCGS